MNPERYARISGLVDVQALARKRAAIIGLGSMGQPIANQLARHGVGTITPGRLRLIDADSVSERNLIGTDYRKEHIGMPKAEAAAAIIREINPELNLSYWNHHITAVDITAIVDIARHSDLLGLFADSFEIMLAISAECHSICPQVMAVFGPNCDYAEVAFSIPGVTPPLSKTMGSRRRQSIATPSALGTDTTFVASFVATLCLELLLSQNDRGRIIKCYADAPLFIMGLRKAWIFENQSDDIARIVSRVHVDTEKED